MGTHIKSDKHINNIKTINIKINTHLKSNVFCNCMQKPCIYIFAFVLEV